MKFNCYGESSVFHKLSMVMNNLECYKIGKRYNEHKPPRGGDQRSKFKKTNIKGETAHKIAKEFHISDRTVRSCGKFAEDIDSLNRLVGEQQVKDHILDCPKPIFKREEIKELAREAETDRETRETAKEFFFDKTGGHNKLFIKSKGKLKFKREASLEDFIYKKLTSILNLKALKQQHQYMNKEQIDILALDNDKRLVLLEVKNQQDRHLVQQLTRYYTYSDKEKPFEPEVNYTYSDKEKPFKSEVNQIIRLIAIAPTYHPYNLIDKGYSKLKFEFWEYEVNQKDDSFYLILKDIDGSTVIKEKIS